MSVLNPVVIAFAQQAIGTDGQIESRQRNLFWREFQLRRDPLQQFLKQCAFLRIRCVFIGRLTEAFPQSIQATLVDRRIARHLHHFDGLTSRSLEISDEPTFPRRHEQNGFTGATRPACSSNAVHIGLAIERHVVIDHQANTLHIQATGRNVRRDQNINGAAAQTFHRAFPLVLGNITIQNSNLMPRSFQGFSHRQCDHFGASKNDHTLATTSIQHPLQGLKLVAHRHRDRPLPDQLSVLIFGFDRDFSWIVEIPLRQATNLRRHRCREQNHLPFFGQLFKNPLHIVDEAHTQHLIGFIEHQTREARCVEGALAHVIHHTARCSHHHINAPSQCADLGAKICSSINSQDLEMGMTSGVGLE